MSRTPRTFARPSLEALEERALMAVVPLGDLAEGNASRWQAFASDGRYAAVSSSTYRVDGNYSLRFTTQSGFDTGVKTFAPVGGWDVSGFKDLKFWTYSVNPTPYGFQGAQPAVVLVTPTGSIRYTPLLAGEMPKNGAAWHTVDLAGSSAWRKSVTGTPDLKRVTELQIHQDTWDYGFTVYYDGMRFSGTAPAPTPAPGPDVVNVKTLLYVFDPVMESHGGLRLHQAYGWQDPVQFAQQTAADLRKSSAGVYNVQFVDVKVVDAQPYFKDGFQHTDASFDAAWAVHDMHTGVEFDYQRFFRENNIAARVDSRALDEVWVYAPPINGTWESAMAGAGAFWVNGPTQAGGGQRAFVTMGLNYERGVGEALHSYGHRVESTLDRVYANMPAGNAWDRFRAIDINSPGKGGVGNVHFPVNGVHDYDYDNRRAVLSTAEDWLNYGVTGLPGARSTWVTSSTWSPTHADPQRDYLNWWYAHIPRFAGTGKDGKLANWWFYVGNPDNIK